MDNLILQPSHNGLFLETVTKKFRGLRGQGLRDEGQQMGPRSKGREKKYPTLVEVSIDHLLSKINIAFTQ